MASDFHVIDDLTPESVSREPSPAHFNSDHREAELELWKRLELTACPLRPSAAALSPSLGTSGTRVQSDQSCRRSESGAALASADTDIPIGSAIAHAQADRWNTRIDPAKSVACSDRVHLRRWSSGITMGLSTRSPCFGRRGLRWSRPITWTLSATSVRYRQERNVLPADEPPPVSRSYDILRSAPKFEYATLKTVWDEIFCFAAMPDAYRPAATGLHNQFRSRLRA